MKHRSFLMLLCLFANTLPAISAAQTAPASSAQTSESATTNITGYAPPPAEYARAKEYSRAHYRQFFFDTFYGFLILLVILRWRGAPAFRDLAERVSKRRSVQLIIFTPMILLAMFFLQPIVIDPMFYTFKPLAGAQPVLVEEMQKVVQGAAEWKFPPTACLS